MALQVWLPLNKDLRNIGLSDVNITNNGAVLATGGVYTNCYSFDGTDDYMYIQSLQITKTMSFALWYNPSVNTNGSIPGGFHHIFDARYNGNQEVLCLVNPSFKAWDVICRKVLTANTWFHICAVNDNGKVSIYVNGNLETTGTTTQTGEYSTRVSIGARNNFVNLMAEKMNDIRIYDHCLTEDDVKRLYQIKVFDLVPYKDDIRGGILFDRSGYCLSAVTPYNLSYKNSCAVFNGTNSSIKIPPLSEMNSGGVFTMNAWFLRKEFGAERWETLFGGPSGFELETRPAASAITALVAYSWGGNSVNKYIPYELNKWVMVTMTRTTSSSKFYINGELKYTGSAGSIPSGEYFIGSWKIYNSSQNMKASISNFQMFKKEFTADEIVELYEQEKEMFLPDDYEELEYIESTGTQWIDTGYLVNSSNISKLKYKLDGIATNTAVGNKWWANGIGGGSGIGFYVGLGNGKDSPLPFTYGRGVSDTVTNVNGSLGVRYKWELDMEKQTYKVWSNDGDLLVSIAFTRQTPTEQKTLPLFRWRRYNDQGGYIFGMKIYHMQLFDDSILVRDMVPSKRKSDNVIGMYDMVSRQFFTNAGTGSFSGE